MALSEKFLVILCCPACKGDLEYDPKAETLTCNACCLRFRVVDDTPMMLVDQAERI
jgi:uncharacterized protein